MTTQLNIPFDKPAPRGYAYKTSLPAFERNAVRRPTQESMILDKVKEVGEVTRWELKLLLGMEYSTVCARCRKLVTDGKLLDIEVGKDKKILRVK